MKRRKFLMISGVASLGVSSSYIQKTEGLEINLKNENSSIQINVSEVESLLLGFEDINITPTNLDDSQPINLSISGSIDNNDIGSIESYSIDFTEDETIQMESVYADITEADKYQSEMLSRGPNQEETMFNYRYYI